MGGLLAITDSKAIRAAGFNGHGFNDIAIGTIQFGHVRTIATFIDLRWLFLLGTGATKHLDGHGRDMGHGQVFTTLGNTAFTMTHRHAGKDVDCSLGKNRQGLRAFLAAVTIRFDGDCSIRAPGDIATVTRIVNLGHMRIAIVGIEEVMLAEIGHGKERVVLGIFLREERRRCRYAIVKALHDVAIQELDEKPVPFLGNRFETQSKLRIHPRLFLHLPVIGNSLDNRLDSTGMVGINHGADNLSVIEGQRKPSAIGSYIKG